MVTLVVGLAIGVYLGIALMSILAISARAHAADEAPRSVGRPPAPHAPRGVRP